MHIVTTEHTELRLAVTATAHLAVPWETAQLPCDMKLLNTSVVFLYIYFVFLRGWLLGMALYLASDFLKLL